QVLSVTADSASNNTTLMEELERQLDEFEGIKFYVRCFAHTLNLTAKATLRQFD
ncbi:hypothetical protein CYLTODRAFT_335045, partial [Cylindrobasidium torrendii FP15055 ss-10]